MSETALGTEIASPRREGRILSPFEFWPDWIFYTPVVLQWIALGLRYGDFSLPSSANPAIAVGGLCCWRTGLSERSAPTASPKMEETISASMRSSSAIMKRASGSALA